MAEVGAVEFLELGHLTVEGVGEGAGVGGFLLQPGLNADTSIRPCRTGTSSGTRDCA